MLTLDQVSELYDQLYDYKKEEFPRRIGHWNDCYQGRGVDIFVEDYYLGIHFYCYGNDGWEGSANIYFHDVRFTLQKEYFNINDMSQLPVFLEYIDKALNTLSRMPNATKTIKAMWEDLWNK